MTLRAGSAVTAFKGVIRDDGAPVWTCEHEHETPAEARACAKAELERRNTSNQDGRPE